MQRLFAERAWLGPGQFARRVVVEFDSRIKSVRRLPEAELPPQDVVRVNLLLPGFVNAHCHLEYTWLEGAGLPRGAVPFGEWMRAIMARRPATEYDRERRTEAMREGAKRLIAGGCTTVFDSSTDGASAAVLNEAGLRHFLFYEVLGLSRERAEPIWKAALAKIRQPDWQEHTAGDGFLGNGLNPHAPYSVGEWLREQLKSAEVSRLPQAWHLAESPDEEELFRRGEGSIADFFRNVNLPTPEMRFGSSFEFLCTTGQLDRCGLAFHGNELSLEEAEFFRAPGGIVHCPGTHRWFARRPVPLREWLDAGVNVCLGTDSLASADTLSMLDVVRMTLEDHPDLSVDDVLTMACVNPWRLGFMGRGADRVNYGRNGVIAEGAVADLVEINNICESSAELGSEVSWRSVLTCSELRAIRTRIGGETTQPV